MLDFTLNQNKLHRIQLTKSVIFIFFSSLTSTKDASVLNKSTCTNGIYDRAAEII